jgi:hypothetical protein
MADDETGMFWSSSVSVSQSVSEQASEWRRFIATDETRILRKRRGKFVQLQEGR